MILKMSLFWGYLSVQNVRINCRKHQSLKGFTDFRMNMYTNIIVEARVGYNYLFGLYNVDFETHNCTPIF